ncbi:hypothetical protein HMPREF3174_03640 [Trueperella sp. HMSC08H06]|nr:hypothetical protein HMPREF3174_03640 [Trueperella sp. HMSC08H06]
MASLGEHISDLVHAQSHCVEAGEVLFSAERLGIIEPGVIIEPRGRVWDEAQLRQIPVVGVPSRCSEQNSRRRSPSKCSTVSRERAWFFDAAWVGFPEVGEAFGL